ncbi:MAG TPA: alpha/beta fold hydrolase [Thermoleophilaceae bacterium]|nr:alpha/beta fold hydrolase [Thermoleophilaceae bacterium]
MDRERAPRVVFVPGFMQRGDAWRPVAERIATSYRTAVLDHRADTFEGRLDEIAAEAARDAVLVGYSMGGRLALHAALRRPRALRALVLVGASAGIEDEGLREERRSADERLADWMEGRSIEEIVERWERVPALASQSRELREALRPGRLSHDPAALASLLRTAGQGTLPPVWDRLPGLPLPVLAVAGEGDDVYVAAAYRMAELLPRGAARLVPGAGHSPQLERPDAFAAILEKFVDAMDFGS